MFTEHLIHSLSATNTVSTSNSREASYLHAVVFYLKKESPYKVEQFFQAVLPLIQHAKFPLLGIDAWIQLYKRFLFYPQIIAELIYLAKKLRGVKPDEQFWKFVFMKSGLNRDVKNVQRVRLDILASMVNKGLILKDSAGNTSSLCQVVFDLSIPQSWTTEKAFNALLEEHKALNLMRFHLEEMTKLQVPGLEIKKAIRLHFTSWMGNLNYTADYKACMQVLYAGLPANFLLDIKWYEVNKLVSLYTHNKTIFDSLDLKAERNLRFNHVMNQLFENYHVGDMFLTAFVEDRLSAQETAWFTFILQGGNLSHAPNLPVRLTKKGAHIVRCTKRSFTSVKQGIFFAALQAEVNDEVYVRRCLIGNIQLTDLDYWVATMTCLYKKGLTFRDVIDVMDYLRVEVLERNHRIDLKHMLLNNLFRTIAYWHHELRNRRQLNAKNAALPVLGIREERFEFNEKIYAFHQIKFAKDLFEEGKTLQHCVYTYLRKCLSGRSYIFSLREVDHKNESLKPLITIELNDNKIVQAKGKRNRYPNSMEMEMIRKWAAAHELKMAA